jgi:2,4-dienoyl-CoA reductase-like NADH-dependent reductase (Old Yellow Enzyme family)/thioredoxin reductase
MPELADLFTPLKIRNTTVRNRIVQSAHITGYVENGLPSDRHVRYYEARAKGGIGLIITEAVAVSPYTAVNLKIGSQGYLEGFTPRARKIAGVIHANGAKAVMQIAHGGSVMSGYYTWVQSQGPSGIPSVAGLGGEVPAALSVEEIKAVVKAHVDVSLKAKDAGYDGVELHFGHGYLVQEFISPIHNVRKDAYGGSLENRMRFSLEIIDAVREAVGDGDFIVGVRGSADELLPGGYTLEDAKQFMPMWARTGKIDYINVTVAQSRSFMWAIPPMMVPPRPFVYCAAEIKQLVDIPVFTVIRINDPVIANEIIKNHEADMVIMTRATLCDPELPNKAREGRLDDIRQCIACNEGCWERLLKHHEPITCMQNPEAGREVEFAIKPAAVRKKVMVVGGGVGGMKAAAVARRRGHKVSLYEKSGELGGAILITTKVPSRQEFSQAVRYLKHEVEQTGVDVHLNTEVTSEMVLKEKPDAVIVATGAVAIDDVGPDVVGTGSAIEIAPGTDVVTAEDVLEGKVRCGNRVVIADQQNYMKGMVTAEFLADQGKDVTLVMPLPIRYISANPYEMDHLTLAVQTAALKAKGVKRVGDCEVKRAGPGKVFIRDVFTEKDEELDADTLVLSYWRKADTRLYDELQGRIKGVHKIGDALSPRRCINAIYEGHKLAMEI